MFLGFFTEDAYQQLINQIPENFEKYVKIMITQKSKYVYKSNPFNPANLTNLTKKNADLEFTWSAIDWIVVVTISVPAPPSSNDINVLCGVSNDAESKIVNIIFNTLLKPLYYLSNTDPFNAAFNSPFISLITFSTSDVIHLTSNNPRSNLNAAFSITVS